MSSAKSRFCLSTGSGADPEKVSSALRIFAFSVAPSLSLGSAKLARLSVSMTMAIGVSWMRPSSVRAIGRSTAASIRPSGTLMSRLPWVLGSRRVSRPSVIEDEKLEPFIMLRAVAPRRASFISKRPAVISSPSATPSCARRPPTSRSLESSARSMLDTSPRRSVEALPSMTAPARAARRGASSTRPSRIRAEKARSVTSLGSILIRATAISMSESASSRPWGSIGTSMVKASPSVSSSGVSGFGGARPASCRRSTLPTLRSSTAIRLPSSSLIPRSPARAVSPIRPSSIRAPSLPGTSETLPRRA